jgi:hypothetical protein
MSDDNYNDNDNDIYGDDNEEKDDFVSEWNAFERVGGKMRLTDDFLMPFGKGARGKDLTPDQIFLKGVQKTIDSYELRISDKDLDLIKNSLVFKINLINYKNPSAFIFAYNVFDNKKNISKEKIESIMDIIDSPPSNNLGLSADYITREDIIRYARLIKKYI